MKDFGLKLEQIWAVKSSDLKDIYKKYHKLSYFALRTKMKNSNRDSTEPLIINI